MHNPYTEKILSIEGETWDHDKCRRYRNYVGDLARRYDDVINDDELVLLALRQANGKVALAKWMQALALMAGVLIGWMI